MNWLVIHKSTKLKGIASDKCLACKVFNNIEEIDFEKLIKMGNVVLKVSNGYSDNVFITEKNTLQDIEKIKKDITFHFNRDYSLLIPEFFHLYSKKRIVLEKMFFLKMIYMI